MQGDPDHQAGADADTAVDKESPAENSYIFKPVDSPGEKRTRTESEITVSVALTSSASLAIVSEPSTLDTSSLASGLSIPPITTEPPGVIFADDDKEQLLCIVLMYIAEPSRMC